jgi:hypothetical protein
MKRMDILHGIEIIIFNHKRQSWHYSLLEKLQNQDYIDWYCWYDNKERKHKYQINATQKGLMYYATQRGKRKSKFFYVLFTIVLLIPYLILLGAT